MLALNRFLMSFVFFLFSSVALAQDNSADQFILKLSEDVLSQIKSDKALLAGDSKKLKELVDAKVAPFINMNRLTASAVGRPWREATQEQRKTLTEEFEKLLMRTYAGAMYKARDAKVSLRPSRNKGNSDTDVVVRTRITGTGSEPVDVDYRLEKNEKGWSIYDVSVLGAWLSQSYAGSFSAEIQNGGIIALIESLKQKNKQ
jgi:phospholipid transport system substrate-binding protein